MSNIDQKTAPPAPGSNGTNGKASQAMVVGPQARLQTIQSLLDKSKTSIMAVLPRHVTIDKFMRMVVAAVSKTPELLDCTPRSIVLAAAQAAALGLEPNSPLGLAYLVPFKKQAQFIPGYKGLIRLAYNSGEINWIQARVIYERDTYELDYGTDQRLVHRPFLGGDAGPIVGVYSVVEMKGGAKLFEFMTLAEVEAIRRRSQSADSGPWRTDFSEMARKTVLRRHTKSLPLSEEKLARALEHQAIAESGNGPDFSDVNVIDITDDQEEPVATPQDRGAALAQKLAGAA